MGENGGGLRQSSDGFLEEVLKRLLSCSLLENILNKLSVDLVIGTLFEFADFMHQSFELILPESNVMIIAD